MKSFLFLTAAAIFAASTAQAALVATFSGTPGSDETTLTFSGLAIAHRSGVFDFDRATADNVWNDVGAFSDISGTFEADLSNLFGKAILTIDDAGRSLSALKIGDATRHGGSFGVGVDGDDTFSFSAGSEVRWSGSMTAIGLDITDLNFNDQLTPFFTSTFGDTDNVLDLELIIAADEISAVPLPAGGVLLFSGLTGVAALRRRQKSVT